MRETLSQLDQICNYYYDAINDYHYFSSQILDMLKVKTENNNLTLSLKHYLQYVHPEDRDRVQEAFDNALEEKNHFKLIIELFAQINQLFSFENKLGQY